MRFRPLRQLILGLDSGLSVKLTKPLSGSDGFCAPDDSHGLLPQSSGPGSTWSADEPRLQLPQFASCGEQAAAQPPTELVICHRNCHRTGWHSAGQDGLECASGFQIMVENQSYTERGGVRWYPHRRSRNAFWALPAHPAEYREVIFYKGLGVSDPPFLPSRAPLC